MLIAFIGFHPRDSRALRVVVEIPNLCAASTRCGVIRSFIFDLRIVDYSWWETVTDCNTDLKDFTNCEVLSSCKDSALFSEIEHHGSKSVFSQIVHGVIGCASWIICLKSPLELASGVNMFLKCTPILGVF